MGTREKRKLRYIITAVCSRCGCSPVAGGDGLTGVGETGSVDTPKELERQMYTH